MLTAEASVAMSTILVIELPGGESSALVADPSTEPSGILRQRFVSGLRSKPALHVVKAFVDTVFLQRFVSGLRSWPCLHGTSVAAAGVIDLHRLVSGLRNFPSSQDASALTASSRVRHLFVSGFRYLPVGHSPKEDTLLASGTLKLFAVNGAGLTVQAHAFILSVAQDQP